MVWVGLLCVIVFFPDHTHLLFSGMISIMKLHFACKHSASNINNFRSNKQFHTYRRNKTGMVHVVFKGAASINFNEK